MTEEEFAEWTTLQAQLKDIKTREAVLRKKLVASVKEDKYATGTFHYKIFGKKIKVAQQDTIKLDDTMLKTLWGELTDEEKDCIENVPKLIKKKYNALPNDCLMKMEVTVRNLSMPTVTLE